ncbi:MFS transporter [Achromobacter agilis]|uniref:Inner membrane metabolite transport protein YhjE n=1 Tax=Achromobacter agilis TaxID=1353888 RepID=A0A446CEC1_9BURK|nr:MFS transporter [Achromobacter agilis]SSW66192.1 Inner membrane metabolite transport protein YhjE [Achromobacter agilis]
MATNSEIAAPAIAVPAVKPTTSREVKRVVAASMAGTVAEWYEFFIYGVASTLVFGPLFFPKVDSPLTSIIAAFATYAVGFVARPLGGIVFGHFGDRLGRKKLLQFSLLLVGSSTFLMGCLPGYATIGFAAPALLVLLRFIQGFAVGGEWGGAVLLISEHSPAHQRGYWASYPQSAACIGNVLASIVLFGLSTLLPKDAFLDWGWRVAFWLSAAIVFVGYYIRRSVEDAPIFLETYQRQKESRKKAASLKDALAAYPRKSFFSILLRVGENTAYYIIVVFSITYLTVHAKLPSQTVMFLMFVANIFQFFSMLFGGYLSDQIGRKACIALGYGGLLVWAFLYFPGLDSGSNAQILGVICLGLFCQALCYGPQAAYFSEIFPTAMRYSGASFCYQIATVVAGSIAPLTATILLRDYDSTTPIVVYLAGTILLSLLALAMLSETKNVSLHDVDRAHAER